MGSGLSMASVNKIKELAAAREYGVALEIIDSQDLSKSLNPQFLRLCGEVYIANGRYIDARRILLMAHKMAPEAKRIIYHLTDLYLRMGYKELADFYYRLYMFESDPSLPETNNIRYIYDKAQGCPFEEIETLLFPMYSDVMDYDWSFELYLLMRRQGRKTDANGIMLDYLASFKNTPNANILEVLDDDEEKLKELFYIYPEEEDFDDSPEQEELREFEEPLIREDELRINPKEAEIQIEFDDNEKISFGAKLKLKKHLREEEKLAKKMQESDEVDTAEEIQQEEIIQDSPEEPQEEALDSAPLEENVASEEKVNIFKKLFSKKKSAEIDTDDTENADEEISEIDNVDAEEADIEEANTEETDIEEADAEEIDVEEIDTEETDSVETGIEEVDIEEIDTEEADIEETDVEEADIEETEVVDAIEDIDIEESCAEETSLDDTGDSVMQEIYEKKKISIVTEIGEDTFVNVQDGEFESGNPFDNITKQNKDDCETKISFVIEEVELQEADEEYEVDDFSQDIEMTEFETEISSDVENGLIEEESETLVEEVYEEEETEEPETLVEEIYEEEETEEPEALVEEIYEEEEIEEPETLVEEIYEEEEIEEPETLVEEIYEEEETEEPESFVEEVYEEEVYEEEETEAPEAFVEEEPKASEENYDYSFDFSLDGESVYDSMKKNKLEYPEFKSSLFPELGESVVAVENNFDEIMTEAQDKINENLLKEEQMQREAEALLASLGIDINFSTPVVEPLKNKIDQKAFEEPVVETSSMQMAEQPSIQETVGVQEAVEEYRPSRDELKESLKIDYVKKDILKQIKEYR